MKIWKIANIHRSPEFWKNLDYSKSNKELSEKFKISYPTLVVKRRLFAPKTVRPSKSIGMTHDQWEDEDDFWKNKIDWEHKTNYQIYNELADPNNPLHSEFINMHGSLPNFVIVSKKRQKHALHTIYENSRQKHPDFSNTDWNKNNAEIGRDLGVSKAIVRLEREKRKIVNPFSRPTSGNLPKHDWKVDWEHKTNQQIADELIQKMIENYHLDPAEISPFYRAQLPSTVGFERKRAQWRDQNRNQTMPENPIIPQQKVEQPNQELAVALSQSWYKIAKQEKIHLTPQERQQVKDRFGDNLECSFAKDKDGYYCYTHRARSKSYDSISKIPFSKVEFIGSTG